MIYSIHLLVLADNEANTETEIRTNESNKGIDTLYRGRTHTETSINDCAVPFMKGMNVEENGWMMLSDKSASVVMTLPYSKTTMESFEMYRARKVIGY